MNSERSVRPHSHVRAFASTHMVRTLKIIQATLLDPEDSSIAFSHESFASYS